MTQEQIEAVRKWAGNPFADNPKMRAQVIATLDHLTTRLSEVERERDEARAGQDLAKQEGVAETLQQIDCFTGGDGEYRFSTEADRNCPDEDAMRAKIVARFTELEAEVARLTKERDEALGTLRWAHETLYEINPSNYDHDEVTKLNDASVEVILGIAPLLGEKHGKTDAWWHSRIEGKRAQLAACQAESAACWKNLVEAGRQRDQARADLATLRAAVDEALAEVDTWKQVPQRGSIKRQLERILLRNLTKPDTPSERIMSDKDRENPVEGAHPTQPEGEDALVEALREVLPTHNREVGKLWAANLRKALASRGLVRGEGVEP